MIAGMEPSATGTLVWPSLQGATNWFSPAYDAKRRLLYVPVREMGSRYFKADAKYEPGKPFMGGGEVVEAPGEAYGAVRALDLLTGERRWEHRLISPLWAACWRPAAGSCSAAPTKATSSRSTPIAVDRSGTSRPERRARATRSPSRSTAQQHVATACGQAVFAFALPMSQKWTRARRRRPYRSWRRRWHVGQSSTSRTLRARAPAGVNGFCRNASAAASRPCRTTASSV